MHPRNASNDYTQSGDVQQESRKTRTFFVHGSFNTIDIFHVTYKQGVRNLSSLTLEANGSPFRFPQRSPGPVTELEWAIVALDFVALAL